MQTSHVISDAILSIAGFYVFFRHLLKLDFSETLLWESFVLSIAVAAAFGAVGFCGITDFAWIGVFFQNLATIVGVISMVAGSWFLVNNQTPSRNIALSILGFGFVLLAIKLLLNVAVISTITSMGGILAIVGISIYGILKGNKNAGIWLLGGVVFAALANFKDKFIADATMATDVYHYLLVISLLCFGIAVTQKGK